MSRFQHARSWPGFFPAILVGIVAGILSWQAEAAPWERTGDRVNAGTVTIPSGNPNGTHPYIASDVVFVLQASLAAYDREPNTQRYDRMAEFVEAFFAKVTAGEFDSGEHHPKWREVNVAAELPNRQRFEPAAKWLRDNRIAARSGNGQLEQQFVALMAAKGADAERGEKTDTVSAVHGAAQCRPPADCIELTIGT